MNTLSLVQGIETKDILKRFLFIYNIKYKYFILYLLIYYLEKLFSLPWLLPQDSIFEEDTTYFGCMLWRNQSQTDWDTSTLLTNFHTRRCQIDSSEENILTVFLSTGS